jgi:hypothetical protein
MTADEILKEIQMLGVRLEGQGDRLHIDAPKGVLKPEHREALTTFKPELIVLVRAREATTVLQALIASRTWRTTKQIVAAVNQQEEAVRTILEALHKAGSVECAGGPILIWKVAQAVLDEHDLIRAADIDQRLERHGCLIAIERKTQEAIPLFKPMDRWIVQDLADVYKPSEIDLTLEQRKQLTDAIDHYERILARRGKENPA